MLIVLMFLSLNDSLLASQSNLIEPFSESDGAKQRANTYSLVQSLKSWVKDLSPLIGLWAEW